MNTSQLREHYQSLEAGELQELHQSGQLSDAGYLAIEEEMSERNISYLPRPPEWQPPVPPPFFKSHWQGSRRLASAFWLVWFIGQKLGFLAAYVIFLILSPVISRPDRIVLPMLALYIAFGVTCVWQCGPNTSWSGWKWISRIFCVGYSSFFLYAIALIIVR
jgi:hypothetical protein